MSRRSSISSDGRIPGFLGREGSYPVDLTIAPPAGQHRLGVLARIVVALPALLLASVFAIVTLVAATLAWFAALARAACPRVARPRRGSASLRGAGGRLPAAPDGAVPGRVAEARDADRGTDA